MQKHLDKFDDIDNSNLLLLKAGRSKKNSSFFDTVKGIYNGIINTSIQE